MKGNTTQQDAALHDREILNMFSGIARVYDRMNGLLSMGMDAAWRRKLSDCIDQDANDLVDLCSGTGELILTAKSRGKGNFHLAADFCEPMLRAGIADNGLGKQVPVITADTQLLPLASDSFDAAMVAFGLRNLGELDKGLQEIARILRPGGQILVLEFFREERSWVQAPISFYLGNVVPLLGKLVGGDSKAYSYLPQSMGRFVTAPEFLERLEKAGFTGEMRCEALSFGVAHLIVARKAI